MSDSQENQLKDTHESSAPEKSGCMTYLGLLLLLAAVVAVILAFVVKPTLEERGVDVQEKLDTVKVKSQELMNSAKDKMNSVGEDIADKYQELKDKTSEIAESEAAGKVKEKVNEIKNSEVVSKTVEKVKTVGSDVAEKAENGTSWY